jgi:hypothetical protein
MLICEYCGELVNEEDVGYSDSYLCTIDGVSYSEKVRGGCPNCGSELVEAYQCEICEQYKIDDDVYKATKWGVDTVSGFKPTCVCNSCLGSQTTLKMALALGGYEYNKKKLPINGFLADIFTPQEIENILKREALKKGTLLVKLQQYCLGDTEAFAECVVNEYDKDN